MIGFAIRDKLIKIISKSKSLLLFYKYPKCVNIERNEHCNRRRIFGDRVRGS